MSIDRTRRRVEPGGAAVPDLEPGAPRPATEISDGAAPDFDLTDFDLTAFGHALRTDDLGYQLARYAPDADIRIASGAPATTRVVSGTHAIWSWLLESASPDPAPMVSHLVDGGDRVAFTLQRQASDGSTVVSISTADLHEGLITTQHTIVVS